MHFTVEPHLTWITTFSTKWPIENYEQNTTYVCTYIRELKYVRVVIVGNVRYRSFVEQVHMYVHTYVLVMSYHRQTHRPYAVANLEPSVCQTSPASYSHQKTPVHNSFIYSNLNHSPRLPPPSLSLSEFLQIFDLPCYHVITSPFSTSTLSNSLENSTFAVKHPNVVFYTTQEEYS